MATAGVFSLITNDGKADRMLNATKMLNQRIKDVMAARARRGAQDVTPTLADIKRTHILYVDKEFKPFAAIGFEYQTVKPQSGSATMGGGVQFLIPQFGDFINDTVVRLRIAACQSATGATPAHGSAAFPIDTIGAAGAPSLMYNIVDAFGGVLVRGGLAGASTNVITGAANTAYTYRNFVRYCEYPANRAFANVKFDVSGNPLDQYDSNATVMIQKFGMSPNKKIACDRLCGQELDREGYGGLRYASIADANSASTPANSIGKWSAAQSNETVGLFTALNSAASLVLSAADPAVAQANLAGPRGGFDVAREMITFRNGPQTPKPIQPPIELWHPLCFNFCKDVGNSIASLAIPAGQRFIQVDFAPINQLVFEFPSIYLETVSEAPAVPANTPLNQPTVSRSKTYSPIFQKLGIVAVGGSGEPQVEKLEMYVNNIFLNPEIHDLFLRRVGFSLVRVFRQQTMTVNEAGSTEKLLAMLKWPTEYIYVGARPTFNTQDVTSASGGLVPAVGGGNVNVWRDWHRLTRQLVATAGTMSASELPALNSTAVGTPLVAGVATHTASFGSMIGQVIPDHFYEDVPTVDSMSIVCHGIPVYNFTDRFFSSYLPAHYGGQAITPSDDCGALMINFALYPGSEQPSGHINISRARETYAKLVTSYISAASPAMFIVVAIALNFLLIAEGSAVLRYST